MHRYVKLIDFPKGTDPFDGYSAYELSRFNA